MEHEDYDTPGASDPSSDVPAAATPEELRELTDVIELTLRVLDEHPHSGETQLRPIHQSTPKAEIRQMWLIENFRPETEVWLDSSGDIWHASLEGSCEQKQFVFSRLDAGGVWHLKSLVLSFMATLGP